MLDIFLIGLAAANESGIKGVVIYMFIYVVMNIAVFRYNFIP